MVATHEKYILKITAGPSYDPSTHSPIRVNTSAPVKISNAHLDADICMRIQEYRGLPEGSPSSSPYFKHPTHTDDRYSIEFSFTLKKSIPGNKLVFGNDFDRPIRDRLPPGFSYAFRIVKWMIDPGLDGDVYADEPHLYGPLLSSINIFNIGGKDTEEQDSGSLAARKRKSVEEHMEVIEEGASGSGIDVRGKFCIPDDSAARKKHFLNEVNRSEFEFEAGRKYHCDFFNPYLDFNEFALKLPGFTLGIINYWDGQPLRYVLKNQETGTELFVIVIELKPNPNVNEEDVEDEGEDDRTEHEMDENRKASGRTDDDDVD